MSLPICGAGRCGSSSRAPVPEAGEDRAEASGDTAPGGGDEPYRRALSGIYARLAATYAAITGKAPPRPAALKGEPYAAPADFRRDLLTIAGGLSSSGKGQFAGIGALGRLIRAVEVFGFHRSEEHTSEPPVTNAQLVCRPLLEK